ncbi:MAG: sigma factor [Clostridium sp.]|uniref:sigma factor n=1 Tax=Clostridium sp. TaxID=1506 RepID=UPI003F3363D2
MRKEIMVGKNKQGTLSVKGEGNKIVSSLMNLEEVYELYRDYIKVIAKNYSMNTGIDEEDLTQEFYIMLIKAFESYDIKKKTLFTTHLIWNIKGCKTQLVRYSFASKRKVDGKMTTSLDCPTEDGKSPLKDYIKDNNVNIEDDYIENELMGFCNDYAKNEREMDMIKYLMGSKGYSTTLELSKRWGCTRQNVSNRVIDFKRKLAKRYKKNYLV